jgi:hypothetical protein
MKKYVFFDTETAGGFTNPLPLQVAFLTNSGESYVYKLSFSDITRICESDKFWQSAPSHFSGIALPARLLSYKLADTIRQFTESGFTFVAHNARHDVRAIRSGLSAVYTAARVAAILDSMPVVDTLAAAKAIQQADRMKTVETATGKQSASLANIAQRFGMEQPEPHDALADCHLLAELADRMKRYRRAGWKPAPGSTYL